jgi:TetR/AcrR family transcriptional regulator
MTRSNAALPRRERPKRQGRAATRDGNTEGRILDAAHAVLVQHGTAGARMQDIAKAAGVNPALLHYYFHTKNRLAEAVFRRAAGQLFLEVIGVLSSDLPLEEKVVRVVEIEIDHLSQTPGLPSYIISELHHHPDRVRVLIRASTGVTAEHVRPMVIQKVRRQIAAAARAGTLQPIDPEQFIVNLLSLCVFPFAARPMIMVLLGLDANGFEAFIKTRRSQLAPFFLRGLRA